jgi:phenylacetate-CoA ligase
MGVVNSVIKKQPLIIKQIFYNLVPFEYRYGDKFRKTYNEIMNNLSLSTEKLKEKQFQELKKLLIHSKENVKYYNKLFSDYNFNPYTFQDFKDIEKLPYLTKDIIKENYQDLVANNYKHKKLYTLKTSGSTGKKLEFLATDDVFKKEAAFILRAYHLHGATLYDKPSIWLRRYVPDTNAALWNYDCELKRLYMSAYHLNQNTLDNYINEINKREYHTLVGYPSSIYALACALEESGKKINIKSIHTASEMMLPQWREKINEVFGINVKSHYGQMEKVSLFVQNKDDEIYSDCIDYSYNEFVNENNQNVVVGTGFLNYAMPFIRYKTNDTIEIQESDTKVGLPKIIKQVNGRCDDILISTDGARLPGVNFYTMMYKIDGVKMFQIIQKSRQNITFKLVKNENFNNNTLNLIENGLKNRIGNVNISFDFVDEIERSKTTGKVRCIFNEIQ